MNEQPQAPQRGNPPNREQLAEQLGDRMNSWNEVRETVVEIGATWKWAYSEATGTWSYRSYLPGDRFFVALTPQPSAFEVSLNLTPPEWDALLAAAPDQRSLLETLQPEKREGEAPFWVHVPVCDPSVLGLLAKMLVIRARRVQKPRLKGQKKR